MPLLLDVFQLTNKSPAYPRVLLPGLHQGKYLRADSAQNSTCLYPNKQVALPETLLPFTSQRAGPPMRNFAPALGKTWLQNNFTTGQYFCINTRLMGYLEFQDMQSQKRVNQISYLQLQLCVLYPCKVRGPPRSGKSTGVPRSSQGIF